MNARVIYARYGMGVKLIESKESLLLNLREGTQENHRRVEEHPLLRPLTASTLSLEHYARVIAAFTGFYEALEPGLKEWLPVVDFPGYRYQPRLPLLVEDRAALPACAVTPCETVPELSCKDELIGVLYVLEGATQGGLVIAPRLRHGLALTAGNSARYFNLYRHNSWQKFRAMVDRCQQHYDYRLAMAAARAAFDHLHCHLDLCLCSAGD